MGGWLRARGRFSLVAALALIATLALAGCADDQDGEDSGAEADQPRVVATTATRREFAEHVAGDDARVTGIVPPGVDLHSFQPRTSAARDVAEADLLIVNGYGAEEGLIETVLENRRDGVPVIVAAAGLAVLEGGHDHDEDEHDEEEDGHDEEEHDEDGDGDDEGGHHDEEEGHDEEEHDHELPAGVSELVTAAGDPHLWLDVANAIGYVENIRDGLVAVDPERRAGYESRAATYVERLLELDSEVRAAVASIPEERRRLVVLHDAYRYFGAAYGLETVAAALPSGAAQEPSAADVAAIVGEVREAGIPAVYAEPQFDAGVLELVAEEAGARVLTLYSVPVGDGGGAGDGPGIDSYEAMMRANAAALVAGLGGPR